MKKALGSLGKQLKGNFAYLLAVVVFGGMIYIFHFIFTQAIDFRDAIMLIVGSFIGMAQSIINYYWGTSKSSKDKDVWLRAGGSDNA